jgi:hypothetical protein
MATVAHLVVRELSLSRNYLLVPRDPGSSPGRATTPLPAAAEIKLEIARHSGQSATGVQRGRDQLP